MEKCVFSISLADIWRRGKGESDMSFIANSCRWRQNMEIKEKRWYNMFEKTDGLCYKK